MNTTVWRVHHALHSAHLKFGTTREFSAIQIIAASMWIWTRDIWTNHSLIGNRTLLLSLLCLCCFDANICFSREAVNSTFSFALFFATETEEMCGNVNDYMDSSNREIYQFEFLLFFRWGYGWVSSEFEVVVAHFCMRWNIAKWYAFINNTTSSIYHFRDD